MQTFLTPEPRLTKHYCLCVSSMLKLCRRAVYQYMAQMAGPDPVLQLALLNLENTVAC